MNQIALPFDWPVADRDEDFLLVRRATAPPSSISAAGRSGR